MSGSIKYFVYTRDNGADSAVKRDESNVEAVNGLIQDYPDNGVVIDELPRNVTPRSARYVSGDGRISKNIVVLTQTLFNALPNARPSIVDAVSGVTLFLRSRTGEASTIPFGVDTALNDGDDS